MITKEIILSICPQANATLVAQLVDPMNKYLPLYQINTLLRLSNFLGQAGEESDSFKTLTEYASGAAYEGRTDLGNTQKGDGVKYKGRGIFMVTGRGNYTTEGKTLGIDLVDNPLLAATPEVAVQTACLYWKTHNLNALADTNDVVGITKKINGGTNGLSVRQLYTFRAASILKPLFASNTSFFQIVVEANATPVVPTTTIPIKNVNVISVNVNVPTTTIVPLPPAPPAVDPEVIKPIMTPEEHAASPSIFGEIKDFFDLGSSFWKKV